MKVLITGSRETTLEARCYVRRVVVRAKHTGNEIIVGDAPGIDSEVIEWCDRLGVRVTVYGGYCKVRNATKIGKNVKLDMIYPNRDKYMAGLCDLCIAVWNGKSRGTRYTYEAANAMGKEAHIRTFPL